MSYKTYTSEFKAKVFIEVLQGDKSLSEIASEYNLNPNMVRNWKKSTSTNTEPRESFAMLLANTFGSTTRSDHTRRLIIKRRTLSFMRHSAIQQPSPPALTVPRWPVDLMSAWVRRSQDNRFRPRSEPL